MLKDYARCLYFESNGNPARALRIASGLFRARVKHDIGPLQYSLFRFSDTPSKEWGNYLRHGVFFSRVLQKANSDDMRRFMQNKVLFYEHCLDHDLPTPTVICVVGKPGTALSSRAVTRIDDVGQWKNAVESAPHELFVKPIDGSFGAGTFIIRRLGQNFIFGPDRTQGSVEDLYRYVLDRLENETALLVQPLIRPHPKLLEISSANGLATARIVTGMINNKAQVLCACAKLPAGANITDNFAHGSSGNLVAAVDIDTGTLSQAWRSARSDWPVMRPTDVHPDTGHQIRGTTFPLWAEVVDLSLRAQMSLPQAGTVGWDITASDGGVMLLEANGHYSIDILQVAYQRGVGSELMSVIEHQIHPSAA
jgi:hypothetical protein